MRTFAEFDKSLFLKINKEWSSPFLDSVMPVVTDLHKQPLFPYVALLLLTCSFYFFWRKTAKVVLILLLAIAAADSFNNYVLKKTVKRVRPSNSIEETVLRTHKHSGYSFPSNHAANNFAGAAVLSFFFLRLAPYFFSFAFLVAYSRVYVGVHYPLDVVAGGIVGVIFGTAIYYLVQLLFAWFDRHRKRTAL